MSGLKEVEFEDVAIAPLAVVGGAAAVGVAAGVAVAGAALAIGVAGAATAVVAVGEAAATIGLGLYQGGKSVAQAIKISAEERKLEKQLAEQLKNFTIKSVDKENLQEAKNSVIQTITQNPGLFSVDEVKSIMEKESDLKKQIEIGIKYIELNAKYEVLKENLYSINEAAGEIDVNLTEEFKEFNSIKGKSLANASKAIDELSTKLENVYRACKEQFERELSNKTFKAQFIKIEDPTDKIIINTFKNRIDEMLKEVEIPEVARIINQKKTLQLLVDIYETCFVMAESPVFEKYAEQIQTLWSKAIKLTERTDISDKDYDYQIDLIASSLSKINAQMEKDSEGELKKRERFIKLLEENNKYRTILYLKPVQRPFDINTYDKDIKWLIEDNEKLLDKIRRQHAAKNMIGEFKRKYISYGYRYISQASVVKESKNYTVYKNYFITPDGKNILSMNVNDAGVISVEVYGVKVDGLADDAQSLYDSQVKFAAHMKEIMNNMSEEQKINLKLTESHEPDLKNTMFFESFKNVLPAQAINEIAHNRRNARGVAEKKRMAI